MLTVEQVRNLDGKVRQAIDLIDALKSENSMLKGKLDEYKKRVDQLESVVDGFKLEQLEIEEGIKDVLSQLDQLEDQITAPSPSALNQAAAPTIPVENVTASPQELGAAGIDAEPEEQLSESGHDSSPVKTPELEIF